MTETKSKFMSEEQFAHMLRLSTIYVDLMRSRQFFDGLDEADDSDKHNTLNCLEIVADTFVEMQRRLGVKPVFKVAEAEKMQGVPPPTLSLEQITLIEVTAKETGKSIAQKLRKLAGEE